MKPVSPPFMTWVIPPVSPLFDMGPVLPPVSPLFMIWNQSYHLYPHYDMGPVIPHVSPFFMTWNQSYHLYFSTLGRIPCFKSSIKATNQSITKILRLTSSFANENMLYVFIYFLPCVASYRVRSQKFVHLVWKISKTHKSAGRDSSVGKLFAFQAEELGSNPGGGLTWVTQYMNERGRDLPAVKVILHQLALLTGA